MQTSSDDHLLMECDVTATLADGTQQEITMSITVGDARRYKADPNPCRCEACEHSLAAAVKILDLQESYLADEITKRQFQRALKRLGYTPEGPIVRH
jgi:hypothetical protein